MHIADVSHSEAVKAMVETVMKLRVTPCSRLPVLRRLSSGLPFQGLCEPNRSVTRIVQILCS